jgi:hypothetical protein
VIIEEAASTVGKPHKTLEQTEIPDNPVVEPSLNGENSPPPYRVLGDMAEEERNTTNEKRHLDSPYWIWLKTLL